ncbi:MAG: hypothetical protein Q7S73_00500, partial [bacterium]|nr:hypothetical protein [bacterium]
MPMIWVSSASELPLIGIENTAANIKTSLVSANISDPGAGGYLGTNSNHPLYFFTNDETKMALLANGNFGVGTTTPSQALSVHGNALFSGNVNVANLIATGTLSVTGTSGTSTINSITIGPNGRFGFSTTTPNIANFEVATRTIAFNSGADGALGAWATANALPGIRGLHSSIIANGYVYVIGGTDGSYQSTIYYAKLNSDGSTGAWSTNANALPEIRGAHSSIVANGYVYVIGGSISGVSYQSTVFYAKLNSDGSTSAWATNANALPEIRGL